MSFASCFLRVSCCSKSTSHFVLVPFNLTLSTLFATFFLHQNHECCNAKWMSTFCRTNLIGNALTEVLLIRQYNSRYGCVPMLTVCWYVNTTVGMVVFQYQGVEPPSAGPEEQVWRILSPYLLDHRSSGEKLGFGVCVYKIVIILFQVKAAGCNIWAQYLSV